MWLETRKWSEVWRQGGGASSQRGRETRTTDSPLHTHAGLSSADNAGTFFPFHSGLQPFGYDASNAPIRLRARPSSVLTHRTRGPSRGRAEGAELLERIRQRRCANLREWSAKKARQGVLLEEFLARPQLTSGGARRTVFTQRHARMTVKLDFEECLKDSPRFRLSFFSSSLLYFFDNNKKSLENKSNGVTSKNLGRKCAITHYLGEPLRSKDVLRGLGVKTQCRKIWDMIPGAFLVFCRKITHKEFMQSSQHFS